MRSPNAAPIPTRSVSEGTGCASATVLGQRPSLALLMLRYLTSLMPKTPEFQGFP